MKLTQLLTPDCTVCAVPATSKKRILEHISAAAAAKLSDTNQSELLESLMKREKMGSTGIGNGIAIPHGRLQNTSQVITVVMTTEQAIPFDAIDNRPVDIFVALFVPEEHCQQHLSTLQSIAKLFSNNKNCKKVRKCQSDQQLFELISQLEQS